MRIFQGIFVLPPDEVTLQGKSYLKKAYRHRGYEMRAIYHGPQFFECDFTVEHSEQVIVCIGFNREMFIAMIQWIETQRSRGFKGRILLSMSSETFDYGVIPKFLACGGSYIIEGRRWKEDPLCLLADAHDESVLTWLHNQHHKRAVEVINHEALQYLFDALLNEDKLSYDTLSYVYEGLNTESRDEFIDLLKQKIRSLGNSILEQPAIERLSEGLITIWDNPEFCCELGTRLSKVCQKKVLIVDLDRLNPTFDMYCPPVRGRKRKGDLGDVQRLYNANKLTDESLNELCFEVKGVPRLKVLFGCGELKKFEYFTNEALLESIARFKKSYDIVLVNVNQFIYDAYACLALIKADYVLVPVDGRITSIRHYQRSIGLLCEKQQISQEKFQYVFFECEEMFSGEMQLLSELLHGPILGWISSCKKRRYFRNLKRTYAQAMTKAVNKEYDALIRVLIS